MDMAHLSPKFFGKLSLHAEKWTGPALAGHFISRMSRDQLLRLLLPLWGVAFVAGFIMACTHR